jgi:hypothetical protein
VVNRRGGRLDFGGELIDRPFVWATLGDGPRRSALGLDQSSADQDTPHHRAIEGVAALGRPPAFMVEDRGDRHAIVAPPTKFADPGDQIRIGAERFQLGDGPRQPMRGPVPAMPMALEANLLAAADHGDDDPLEQQSGDGLTLLPGRRLGPPEGG